VSLGKTLNRTPPPLSGRQVATTVSVITKIIKPNKNVQPDFRNSGGSESGSGDL